VLTARSESYRSATMREMLRNGLSFLDEHLTADGDPIPFVGDDETRQAPVSYIDGIYRVSGLNQGLLLLDLLEQIDFRTNCIYGSVHPRRGRTLPRKSPSLATYLVERIMSDFAKQYIQEHLSSGSDELHRPNATYLDFVEAARALNLKYDAEDREDRTYMTIYSDQKEGDRLKLVFG